METLQRRETVVGEIEEDKAFQYLEGGREEEGGGEEGGRKGFEGRRDRRVEEGEGEEKDSLLTSQQNSMCGLESFLLPVFDHLCVWGICRL